MFHDTFFENIFVNVLQRHAPIKKEICLNRITYNKLYWKTVKAILLNEGVNTTQIYLVDENKTLN